jgi:hypothetical protein
MRLDPSLAELCPNDRIRGRLRRRCVAQLALLGLLMPLWPAGPLQAASPALYDPQPPADSAYLRILLTAGAKPVQVWVDGSQRLPAVAPLQPSNYLVVSAGTHKVRVQSGALTARFEFQAVAGRASTAVLAGLDAKSPPLILEDKPSGNRLKALITAYHFAPGAGPLDILTADGAAKVFSELLPGQSASLPVNPVAVDLIVTKPGEKLALAKMSLQLTAGGAYSLVLTPSAGAGVAAAAHTNQVERYSAP